MRHETRPLAVFPLLAVPLLAAAAFAAPGGQDARSSGHDPTAEQPASGPGAADPAGADVPMGRLPDTARPLRYRLALRIDPDASHFSGRTEIDVELADAVQGIWLHGQDLDVGNVMVRAADGREQPAHYRQRADIGVARVSFDEPVGPGRITLAFDYRAPFNDSLEGLYKITVGGRHYASTQFEATSARLAFPGFDEPRFKVPFDITLTVPEGQVAVTNTPAVSEEPADDGFVTIRYAESLPLPTYLLAFIVGPWDERVGEPIPATAIRKKPIPLRAFAAAGKGEQLDYALAHTAEIVIGLEEYFGIAYPYDKLDIIAVPDFAAGAMENAGAITYREQLLLIQPDSSVVRRQSFASVNAHELAHQWFGDLVTPEWWNDIWLNEAFATWMAAKVMNRLQPEQGYAMRQLKDSLAVMHDDAQVSARRIRQPIATHADIGSAFDGITYDKGGAVLAMLERFVGADNFQRGIHRYMEAHRFGNADARDFVRAIAATRPDLPEGQVEKAFFSFLEQPGTPLAAVDWTCADDTARVSVKQSRYLPLGSKGDPERDWLLPMCIAYGDGGERREHCQLVQGQTASFALPASSCPEYVMPNADGAGYYRFVLDGAGWRALLDAPDLTDAERLAAAASLSGAFHAGDLQVGDYLDLIPALLASGDPAVVSAPLADLEWIHDRLLTPENQRKLRNRLATIYSDAAARVPLDETPADSADVRLQQDLAELCALLIEAPSWRQQLTRRAVAYVEGGGAAEADDDLSLPTHLRETAFTVAVETKGSKFAERLLDLFDHSTDAVLREEILRALSRGADEPMLARLRELTLTDQLRDNELQHVLTVQMEEPDSRAAAWQWLLDNFDAVAQRVPYWRRGSLVELASGFCSSDQVTEIQRELADKLQNLGGGPRSLATTIERIRLCEALVAYQEDSANTVL